MSQEFTASLFQLDGLGLIVAALTVTVTAVVIGFSRRYMRADLRRGAFTWRVGLFTLAVLVLAFAGNVLVVTAAWVAGGRLMVGLIGHAEGWAAATRSARLARRTFLLGDLALVAAMGMLAVSAATLEVAAIKSSPALGQSVLVSVAAVLLVFAAAVRCGLPPFATWLVSSMPAPTPVSALMHAGFVNAGGLLLVRFAPVLEAAPIAAAAALACGATAAIYGLGLMLVRSDVKSAFAGSTVSQMGFMIATVALGAYSAAIWHMVAHGLFKACLFLGSGSAIGATRRNPFRLSFGEGLATAAIATGAVLALTAHDLGQAALPIGLAIATAVGAAFVVTRSPVARIAKVRGLALILALAMINAAGLSVVSLALEDATEPLIAIPVQLGLLAAMLALWVWQARQEGRPTLPPTLYAALLNAGSPTHR